ncbi:hypothetical protein ACJX0J_005349, partial [Zea mays]
MGQCSLFELIKERVSLRADYRSIMALASCFLWAASLICYIIAPAPDRSDTLRKKDKQRGRDEGKHAIAILVYVDVYAYLLEQFIHNKDDVTHAKISHDKFGSMMQNYLAVDFVAFNNFVIDRSYTSSKQENTGTAHRKQERRKLQNV